MKCCCEKCFSDEKDLRDYLTKNHEKVGKCDYCGSEEVKLIDVAKMKKALFDIIDKKFFVISEHEADCVGEDSQKAFYEYGGESAISLDEVLEGMEDEFLAEKEWYLNTELYDDMCVPEDYDGVLYVYRQ